MSQHIQRITEANKAPALALLQELYKQFSVDEKGNASWRVDFGVDINIELLLERLKLGDLGRNDTVASDLVMSALGSVAKQGIRSVTVEDFERELDQTVREWTSKSELEWHILAAFPITPDWFDKNATKKVLDIQLTPITWSNLNAFEGAEDFWQNAARVLDCEDALAAQLRLRSFLPLMAHVRAKTSALAFERASIAFRVFRSAINFEAGFGQWVFFWGRDHALAHCKPPPVYGIYDSAYKFECMYYSAFISMESPKAISQDKKDRVELILATIPRTAPGNVRDRLVHVLDRYSQAMDTADWDVSYLALWQALELAAFGGSTTKMDDVVHRIALLLELKDDYKRLLSRLASRRNILVHQGEFSEEGLRQVHLLKMFVESAFRRMLALVDDLQSDEDWRFFYESAGLSTSNLQRKRNVIETILHRRGTGKEATSDFDI